MKKDGVYSLRMPKRVIEALREAARKDHRTVASLLDKIVTEYLSKEGYLRGPEFGTERRRFSRKKIPLPAKTVLKIGLKDQVFPSVVLDISMDGVSVAYPKGSEIRFIPTGELSHFELYLELPQADEGLCFHCKALHMRETLDQIQIGATFIDPNKTYLQELGSYLM